MTDTPIPASGPATLAPAELVNMSTQALRGELARAMTLSAQHLAHMATIWAELERRGEDLSDLRIGLASYLPLIAAGQLDAEALVRFAGQKTLLRHIATLPRHEQHRLAMGGTVPVLVLDATGEPVEQQLPANYLTAHQVRQVFDDARIRSVAEQRNLLPPAVAARPSRAAPPDQDVYVDPKTGRLRVGRKQIDISEVMRALSDHYEDDAARGERTQTKSVPVHLSEIEHRALRIHAAESGRTMESMVYSALRACGLLG